MSQIRKFIYLTAVVLLIGHALFPHQHHDEISEGNRHSVHHNDKDDHHHTIFSFGKIDENFIPVKIKASFGCGNDLISIPLDVNDFWFKSVSFNCLSEYSFKNEFPPPGNFIHSISFRGPPAV